MTKEQLARWRSLGFAFDEFYDTIAKDETIEVKIINVSFTKVEEKNATYQKFIVKILLSTNPYNSKVTVEIDERQFIAYQKLDTIQNINTVFADVFIDFATAGRIEENFKLTVNVTDSITNNTTDTKTINVKVDDKDGVGETQEKVENAKKDINSIPVKSITLENLIAFGVSKKKATEYLDPINKTLQDYKIDNDLRVIHFLAQVIHESISLLVTSEKGKSDSDYNGYKGRGFMQLTGENNYKDYEEYEVEDFTSGILNKQKNEKVPYAVRSAGWFWSICARLNNLADENDFIYITKTINGGYNHYEDRIKHVKDGFRIFKKEFKEYIFKDSKAYNDEKACFGWGLWHDPLIDKVGFKKNKEIAIEGYKRYLELVSENCNHTNWYKILTIKNFSNLKYKKDNRYYVIVIDVAKQQLQKLKEL